MHRLLCLLSLAACVAPPEGELPEGAVPPPTYGRSHVSTLGPSTDLNGDGRADACARSNSGLRCELSDGTRFQTVASTVLFGDSSGFDDPIYYRSLRFGDITGDGRADVCVRASDGIVCLPSTGSGWSLVPISGPPWSDALGYDSVSFASEIRMLDVDLDGLADLCAPTGVNAPGVLGLAPGWTCHLATGTGFETSAQWGPYDGGTGHPNWYEDGVLGVDIGGLSFLSRMHFGGTGDRSAVWLRGPADVPGVTFNSWPFLEDDALAIADWTIEDGTLDAGWPWLTLANVFPGPDLDAVAFTPAGIEAITWEAARDFDPPTLLLSTAAGAWPATVDTVLWGDLSGDGLDDVCARTSAGMRCRLNLGNGSLNNSDILGPAWSNAAGWGTADKYSTIRFADIDGDGRADLCGRGSAGMRCARSLGLSFAAEGAVNGWTDAAGWTDDDNYLPLHVASLPVDADFDFVPDAAETCDDDPAKTAPGVCGCGSADVDSDGDGALDCHESCPFDPLKTEPGACGCFVLETDGDGDGTPDCVDTCPTDPAKSAPGQCGCLQPDTDGDGDGTANCLDQCPIDPAKIAPGTCGCGTPDDANGDGFADCLPCGNGSRAPAEQCDDGAHVAGDGCSPICELEDLVIFSLTPGTAGTSNTFVVGGGTPGQSIVLVASLQAGSTAIPGCPGVTVPIRSPIVLGSRPATGASRATFQVTPPATAAGQTARFVAVELSSCRVSAVRTEVL